MNRRNAIATMLSLIVPQRALGESSFARPKIVGFVGFATPEVDQRTVEAFRQGLRALGHIEGRTVIVDARSSDGNVERGHSFITELASLPVDVFLSPGPAASRAIVRKTKIPVVAIALPGTQVEPELFSSLSRPGGTVTGFSAYGEEMSAKRLELLREILPRLRTVGVLHNGTDPTFRSWGDQTVSDARNQGLDPIRLELSSADPRQVHEQVEKLRAGGGTAMIVVRDFLTSALMSEIGKAGADHGIAAVAEHREFTRSGALFSYGADISDLFRRAAAYVDRILKGENAGELPIQLPTKFELTVNLKTAHALGLSIPASILVRAEEVIE
jgi:putative tryptophan/tyrosine transport system substrate-binding protein